MNYLRYVILKANILQLTRTIKEFQATARDRSLSIDQQNDAMKKLHDYFAMKSRYEVVLMHVRERMIECPPTQEELASVIECFMLPKEIKKLNSARMN